MRDRMPWVKRMIDSTRELYLPGFEGVPLYNVLRIFFVEAWREGMIIRAKSIAFTFFLALFPGILFFTSLIAYIPVENLNGKILDIIGELVPTTASVLLETVIRDVTTIRRGSAISIGLVMTLFISSNGMMAMMASFDENIKGSVLFVRRSPVKKRLIAVTLTLVLFVLLVISVGLIFMGNKLLILFLNKFNSLSVFNFILVSTIKFIIIFLLFFSSISLIYNYGPSYRKKWGIISPGSTFATFLSIILSIAFSFFINNILHPGRFFGSIGTIIVLQVWIYLNSMALLLGFELNHSIDAGKEEIISQNVEVFGEPETIDV